MKKILIANRGEIACRIMRTAKKMGIATVAVFSEVDREAPHVIMADKAVLLGPAPSNASYLNGKKIIEIALSLDVDGIHPGYGFLSENAAFASDVTAAGIKFIGPSPEAIRTMGSKLAAKAAVSQYDIPTVPGTDEAISDPKEAERIADQIGFPVLIKASAGGGGKGMRIVHDSAAFSEQLDRAVGEATSAFGDGSVFIEKYLEAPKHIEIQVLADQYGNTLHLFERDCSVQRRHQKVVEEAPGRTVDSDLRNRMGAAAVRVAQACQYEGAGTVEFLLDANEQFYFLEMNTRLQVEHPVTEMITGLDLVGEQIKIASGHPLKIKQEDLQINGHAIELRVYAEDPLENFIPSVGRLERYKIPSGEGVRVDNGYREGMEIPIHYDPMLAKLVCHGENREEAIERMIKALASYEIQGIKSTLGFGTYVLSHPIFKSGRFTTHFVDTYFTPDAIRKNSHDARLVAAKAALQFYLNERSKLKD